MNYCRDIILGLHFGSQTLHVQPSSASVAQSCWLQQPYPLHHEFVPCGLDLITSLDVHRNSSSHVHHACLHIQRHGSAHLCTKSYLWAELPILSYILPAQPEGYTSLTSSLSYYPTHTVSWFLCAACVQAVPTRRATWFPGNQPPPYLDGSLPGDFGKYRCDALTVAHGMVSTFQLTHLHTVVLGRASCPFSLLLTLQALTRSCWERSPTS